MIRIGIDFSLNSPGACVETNDGQYHFITFFNYGNRIWDDEGRKIPKAFSVHKELIDSNALLGFPYNREVTSKEFLPRERQKLEDAGNISSLMVNIFSTLFEGDKVICSYLDPIHWHEGLKENYVYVFITQSDILIRRIESQDKKAETVFLKADNSNYQELEVKLMNLKEIWYVRAKFSPFLPSPKSITNLMRNELQSVHQAINKQTQVIETLQNVLNTSLKK